MYTVTFNTRQYQFTDPAEANKFAEAWGVKAEYKSLCGDPQCQCESLCKSFKFTTPLSSGEGQGVRPLTIGHEQEDYQLNN
jgi:hypothetical protein